MKKLLLLGTIGVFPIFAATLGQSDNFTDGTTQGWQVATNGLGVHPAPPQNVNTGGPTGAGDYFLLLNSLGGGFGTPGSRLTVNNYAQWAGDYTTEGVTQIGVDLKNFGATDLHIRLFLENPAGAPPTDSAFTDDVLVPASGGWIHATFDVSASGLTVKDGNPVALLSGVTGLRIYNSLAASFPGESIVAQLGVDNVTAEGAGSATIPEPATVALAGTGLLAIAIRRLRRAKTAR